MSTHFSKTDSSVFNGRAMTYTYSLDLLPVRSGQGKDLGNASVFSYIGDVNDPQQAPRPVIFLFNGGPGSSSIFLHLSGLGPKHVVHPLDLASGLGPPYSVEDNANSILDVADLVFIDPIETGFGRVSLDVDSDELFSVEGDARYFADIIAEWISRNNRWNSRKFICGESYGTQRASFIATDLLGFTTVPLDGIILLGQAINVQETLERPGNVSSAVAALSFKAATAWFHGKGSRNANSVDEATADALEFAYGDLATAMTAGNRLSATVLEDIAKKLEYITGIDAKTYVKRRLWHSKKDFRKELFKDEELVVGAFDTRYLGQASTPATGETDFEPSLTHLLPAYAAGISQLVHDSLGVPFDTPYRVLDSQAEKKWDWSDVGSNNFMTMGKPSPFHTYPYPARLTRFLKQVPSSKIFIGTGYYDSLTTIGAVEHLLRQYDIPLDRVTEKRYEGGHMMYSDPGSAKQLVDDLRDFVTSM